MMILDDKQTHAIPPEVNHDPLAAWQLNEDDFPRTAPLSEKLRFLTRYAILAPSSHNTQPWLFRIGDLGIELYADLTRSLIIADPDYRELFISCGAALFNLQMAMRHFGYQDRVELFPDKDNLDLVAYIEIGDSPKDPGEATFDFGAMLNRHSNRAEFETRPVPGALLSACTQAAHEHGAWLHLLESDDERSALTALVAEADQIQMANEAFREELATWLHSNRNEVADGMPGYAFGMGDIRSIVTPLVVRTFDTGRGQAAVHQELLTGSPVLGVLGTDADDPEDWVHTGQALESIVLRAQAEGVSSSFLNQPVEIPALRAQLAKNLGLSGFPQFVIRMGYGPAGKPTPRRPFDEFLINGE